jgi:thiamine-phosphate pyrophosphorylase
VSRSTLRIIDASANRAREALRVMEDGARFLLDDAPLCERLKQARHELRDALDALPGAPVAHRDTPADVGTTIATNAEMSRPAMRDVVIAAGKRLTESLRSLEECAKTIDPCAAQRLERLRYDAYDLDAALTLAMGAAGPDFTGWRLCLLLTESLCVHHDWRAVATAALTAGADAIQLREKDLPDRELLARAVELNDLCRAHSADLIVNDRPDIALLAGARAVHLGQDDMSVREARRIVGFDLLVGVSTANMEQARQARRDGADTAGVGPMFASTTKAKPALSGPDYLHEYLHADPPLPPCLAISGVTPDTVPALLEAADGHPFGVAVSSYICAAQDPAQATRNILDALTRSAPDAAVSARPAR